MFVCESISNFLFSESLIETFMMLAQILATVYQYSAKLDQPKKKQLLLIAQSSLQLQQILKANAEILREFRQTIFHEDNHQECSFNSNSKHNWINKADAASHDRLYFPPACADFESQC